jgi:hypothetical protein
MWILVVIWWTGTGKIWHIKIWFHLHCVEAFKRTNFYFVNPEAHVLFIDTCMCRIRRIRDSISNQNETCKKCWTYFSYMFQVLWIFQMPRIMLNAKEESWNYKDKCWARRLDLRRYFHDSTSKKILFNRKDYGLGHLIAKVYFCIAKTFHVKLDKDSKMFREFLSLQKHAMKSFTIWHRFGSLWKNSVKGQEPFIMWMCSLNSRKIIQSLQVCASLLFSRLNIQRDNNTVSLTWNISLIGKSSKSSAGFRKNSGLWLWSLYISFPEKKVKPSVASTTNKKHRMLSITRLCRRLLVRESSPRCAIWTTF